MEVVERKRVLNHTLETSIGIKGVREDDDFVLDLFQERKRTIRLKRTKYKIKTASKFFFDFKTAEIHLPVFEYPSAEFELMLIPHFKAGGFSDKSRYLVKSCGEFPFKLNGNQCFEAYLERGDVLEIGFNRIHFLKPKSQLQLLESTNLLADEIIKSSLNILLEGQTGTGKTTLAKSIHQQSGRSGAFVPINLSSFAPTLIESELFGHVKGAFTGAIADKKGAILEAHRGTLFLDEIDSLSMELQTKLLLFLDHFELRAVGGSYFQKADVRLIFASGSDLKNQVERGKMRKDFYFRLCSGEVLRLPSLKDDSAKIKSLCLDFEKNHFVVLSDELISFYQECSWPGNIRQLQSHLLRKKIMAGGKKILRDKTDFDLLSDNKIISQSEINYFKSLEEIKMDYCLNVFMKLDKNLKKASKMLDISPNTLKALLDNRKSLSSKTHDDMSESMYTS